MNYFILKLCHRRTRLSGHLAVKDVTIADTGKGNTILAGRHVILENCHFCFQGDGHRVELGDGIRIQNVSFFFEKEASVIRIGSSTWLGHGCELCAFAGTTLSIGSNTLLAPGCKVRTSDSHVIKDNAGKVINKPQDISIGNHCWLGDGVFVLKGVNIPDGCIVGARSIITASTSSRPNSILVGQPAKLVKQDINWEL